MTFYITSHLNLFKINHTAHLTVRYSGRNKIMTKLKNKYCNVIKEVVMKYLELYTNFQTKND